MPASIRGELVSGASAGAGERPGARCRSPRPFGVLKRLPNQSFANSRHEPQPRYALPYEPVKTLFAIQTRDVVSSETLTASSAPASCAVFEVQRTSIPDGCPFEFWPA